ncbi:hypothetical protein ACP70R_005571 [Stipagrostis hirtigluma subsp. patula]
MESSTNESQHNPAASLTDDLLLEILARVPYRSLCRFQCVSRSWLALCSGSDLRKKLPRTLSGFFHHSKSRPPNNRYRYSIRLTNVDGGGLPVVDPSLSFLPTYAEVHLVDCCNGLLLFRCAKGTALRHIFVYAVCNPTTQNWTELPDSEMTQQALTGSSMPIYLGFDPALSSHFSVFSFVLSLHPSLDNLETSLGIKGVEIYSSETGSWTYRKSGWSTNDRLFTRPQSVFFNGILHLLTRDSSILTVDMAGVTWRRIPTPHRFEFIGLSQGYLYAVRKYYDNDSRSIWILKDYGGAKWGMKHTVKAQKFGINHLEHATLYTVIAIHPESSLIFLNSGIEKNLISYDMDKRTVRVICTPGSTCVQQVFPYVPCFTW